MERKAAVRGLTGWMGRVRRVDSYIHGEAVDEANDCYMPSLSILDRMEGSAMQWRRLSFGQVRCAFRLCPNLKPLPSRN